MGRAEWIELGAMFYGNISPSVSYALSFSQGLNAEQYLSGTWIRRSCWPCLAPRAT